MSKEKAPRRVADNEALAVGTQIRGSAQKLNLVATLIRGRKVEDALNILAFSKKAMAVDVRKVLASAIANAENNHNLDVDALVVARSPFIPGCVVRARPIAVLNLEDEAGGDEKLVCVPVDSTFPYYSNVGERDDLPEIVFQQIEHFFTHYKDLEKKKWVRIGTWGGAEDARQITVEAIERYQAAKKTA